MAARTCCASRSLNGWRWVRLRAPVRAIDQGADAVVVLVFRTRMARGRRIKPTG